MGSKSVMYGVATTILVGAIAYGINIFLQKTKDEETRLFGLAGLLAAATLVLYAFVWTWNNVRTWSFYLLFVPMFVSASFDFLLTLDLWREPNGLFLTEYLRAKDPHLHNVVITMVSSFEGTVLYAINLLALWRLGNGQSSRSLQLVSATGVSAMVWVYVLCALTSELPFHLETKTYLTVSPFWLVLLPFGVLKTSRSFTLSHNEGSGKVAKLLALITLPSLAASAAVIVAKALVLNGVRNEYLDFVRLNDPLIALNDVKKTFPYIAAIIWQNVIVSLPLLIVFVLYHLKSSKPTLLWELSIINFGLALLTQFTFIAGSLYWKTPKNLQANPANLNFWAINLLPVTAALLQIVNLLPFRVSLVSVKAKAKKRS